PTDRCAPTMRAIVIYGFDLQTTSWKLPTLQQQPCIMLDSVRGDWPERVSADWCRVPPAPLLVGNDHMQAKPGIVIACDVASLERLGALVTATCQLGAVSGYKLGFSLALRFG